MRRLRSVAGGLPRLIQLGLFILAVGVVLDEFYHIVAPGAMVSMHYDMGRGEYRAHLVTLVGMVVTLVGVFIRR